jgi:NADPH-dependent F420 reductase
MSLAGASNAEAAEAEIVVAATPWEGAVETLAPLASGLAEKVVVSVGNALLKSGGEMHALVPPRGSVAQLVQSALPDSMVAAAFHHLPAHDLLDLARPMEGDVLVCSDQPEAKKSTLELVSLLGGLRGLDAGSLSQAGAIEAFTAVLVTLNMRYRCHATVRIGGIDPGATGGGR